MSLPGDLGCYDTDENSEIHSELMTARRYQGFTL